MGVYAYLPTLRNLLRVRTDLHGSFCLGPVGGILSIAAQPIKNKPNSTLSIGPAYLPEGLRPRELHGCNHRVGHHRFWWSVVPLKPGWLHDSPSRLTLTSDDQRETERPP